MISDICKAAGVAIVVVGVVALVKAFTKEELKPFQTEKEWKELIRERYSKVGDLAVVSKEDRIQAYDAVYREVEVVIIGLAETDEEREQAKWLNASYHDSMIAVWMQ